MTAWLARLLDRFIDRIVPPFDDTAAANWLADWEENTEVFEPTDAPATPRAGAVSVSSPGAAASAVVGAGGLSERDERIVAELVADYEEFLRDLLRE